MTVPFVDLKAQYNSIKEEINQAIQKVIDDTAFIRGKYVENFEKSFAEFCGAKYCVGVGSGTCALHLPLLALGIGQGDEVITAVNTFIATSEAISATGAKPIFVDVDPKTYNIDVNKIEKAITKKTKAIVPVHLYGQPADMDPINEIAKKYNLKVMEDSAQAHCAEYKGKRTGTLAEVAGFSFYPGKNLGAYGDAGAVVTNNPEIAEKVKMTADHGSAKKYEHLFEGYNHRMDGIQGAILQVKLAYLEKWTEARRKNASLYNRLLADVKEVVTPFEMPGVKHVYHLYVIKAERRDELRDYLSSKGIGVGMHYPIPLHLQKAYQHLGYKKGDFPVTEEYTQKLLSLPMFAELTEEQINFVVSEIKNFYKK